MNPGFLVKFCFFLKCFSSSLYHYDIGLQINTSTRKADFESVAFRTFDFENILNNDNEDSDKNLFNNFNFKDSQYFTPEESSRNLNNLDKSSFSMLHLNIRSL